MKHHATELFELSTDHLSKYWTEVARVAEVLNRLYQPAKMNYCVFGNLVPNVHCHLVPLGFDQDPYKPLNMGELERFLTQAEYEDHIDKIRQHLMA